MIELLQVFALDPNNPENNFQIALEYDALGQTASAVSFYIRTAERASDDTLKYECLIRAAMCFEKQGTRKFSVKGLLQHAIAVQPKRPEGYYMLSMFYEHDLSNEGRWFDSYLTASIGLSVSEFDTIKPLRTELNYPGKYGLLFQKAHSAWWCGLCEDSKNLFLDLHINYDMTDEFREAVKNNLIQMNAFSSKSLTLYSPEKFDKFETKFDGLETIQQNYSEAYQDMFVLSMLNGKKNGTYLEIGSGDPVYGNNTYLLEKDFGWKGISLDISEEFVKAHNEQRAHHCVLKDATTVNYEKFLKGLNFENVIDYLQIDVDPAEVSFKVLLAMPFDTIKFGVITFEHDHYTDPKSNVRSRSRKYLESYGYQLVVDNISPDDNRPYEDWYVHPDIVSPEIVSKMLSINGNTKKAEKYMIGEVQ